MPTNWDFTLYFTDDKLKDNPEAVAWLKACEERIRKEIEGNKHATP